MSERPHAIALLSSILAAALSAVGIYAATISAAEPTVTASSTTTTTEVEPVTKPTEPDPTLEVFPTIDREVTTTTTAPATTTTVAPTPPVFAAAIDDSVWDRLAGCETGGRWNANDGNGYGGGVQFAHSSGWSTWRAFGGVEFAPDPWSATREQQIVVATRVLARSGWSAWPGCSAKLGL